MFTMHGTTMVFLVGMPLAVAFGNYLIPLQIGARDVAFPRLNMFGYWVILFGGLFIYSSFFLGGAPNGGWFGYTPLDEHTDLRWRHCRARGPTSGASGIVHARHRVHHVGHQLHRHHPQHARARHDAYAHARVHVDDAVVAFLTVFAMPIITAAMIMVFFDRNYEHDVLRGVEGRRSTALPAPVLVVRPSRGVHPHPAGHGHRLRGAARRSRRKPLFGYSVVVFSGIAIGFMGWGVWAHHMFATGLGPVAISAFGLSTMLIAIPTGVKIFNWLGTVYGGAVRLTTAMLFSFGFIAMFTLGGLSGVLHSIVPADTQQTDTYFVVAHFHYVLFGGLILRRLRRLLLLVAEDVRPHDRTRRSGKWNFWLMLIGFNLTFFPMHILGLTGMPRRTYRYPSGMGWDIDEPDRDDRRVRHRARPCSSSS